MWPAFLQRENLFLVSLANRWDDVTNKSTNELVPKVVMPN